MSSAPGTPMTKLHAGGGQQREQRVHVVLVGLGVVGVADVDPHRQAQQLAAEMILQPGADDLLAVVEIFRADEADDGVDQQRPEAARHRVGARLERLLVDAVMRVGGERAALAGLEIHHVVADGAAVKRQRGRVRLAEQREVDAEALVGGLRAGDRLEHQIDRRAWRSDRAWWSRAPARRSASGCRACCASRRASRAARARARGLSVAGLMPMTASPAPSSRPSRMLAAMPAGSSVG